MTINAANNNPRVEYTVGEGATQTVFTIPFEFFEDPEVKLYVDGVLKTQGSGDGKYTVTGGEGSTGTATFNTVSSGPQPVTGVGSNGSTVIIVRDIPIERVTDFSAGADINRAALNTQLDTLTALVSDADTNILRTLTAPVTDANIDMSLPDKATRAGKALGFNSSTGNPEAITFYDSAADVRAAVEAASDSNVFTDADHSKLDGIEANATADQTASEIRTLVESATDSNVFTDADHTKLNAIEDNATADQTASEILTAVKTVDGATSGLDADLLDGQHGSYYETNATNVTAAGALMDSEVTNLAEVKAFDSSDYATAAQGATADAAMPKAGGTFTGDISFEGATANDYETTITVTDPTADRTITLPNASGTVLLSDGDGSNLTNVQAASVDIDESTDDDVNYNILFSDTSGSGSIQMTPQQDNDGFTFNPSSNLVATTGSFKAGPGTADSHFLFLGYGSNSSSEYVAMGVQTGYASITAGGVGSTSTDLRIRTANSGTEADKVTIKADGKTGIGTTSPSEALDVVGNIAVSGSVDGRDIAANIPASLGTAGQVLTVNSGASAAEWADASGGGSALTIKDEGTALSTDASSLNFVGAAVTASGTGADKTITISSDAANLTGTLPAIDGSNLTNVEASKVYINEVSDSFNDTDLNVLFSDTSGSGNVQMQPQQDDGGLTFNPNQNILKVNDIQVNDVSAKSSNSHLYLRNLHDNFGVYIQADNGSGGATTYVSADGSTGEAGLYHYGNSKLKTKAGGVYITGDITVSGTVDGRDIATNIPSSLGSAGQVLTVNSGASAAEWADAGGSSVGGSTGVEFDDNVKVKFGSSGGNELEIYTDGTSSYITESGSSHLNIQGQEIKFKNASGTSLMTLSASQMEVFHSGSKKLETYSGGIQTTGTVNVNNAYTLPTADGSANQVLTAAGDGTTSWAAASGGGAWNLISTTTVSSSVVYVDYTSIGSYNRYVLLWQCTMSSANLPRLQIYDNGTIVDTSNYSFMRHDLGGGNSYDTTSVGVIGTTGVVSSFGRFEINTDAPRAVYNLTYGGFTGTNDTANHFISSGGMKSGYSITNIDGFRFRTTSSSAVITGGKFSLYGISQ